MKKLFLFLSFLSILSCAGIDVNDYKPFWAQGIKSPSARFELAKRTEPELIAFLRSMPKGGDLHNHLTGTAFSEYLLLSAWDYSEKYSSPQEAQLVYNVTKTAFVLQQALEGVNRFSPEINYPEGEEKLYNPELDTIIPIEQLVSNSKYRLEYLNAFSMLGYYPNTTNGAYHFFDTFPYIGSAGKFLKEFNPLLLAEVVHRNLYQKIQYLEIMTGCVPGDVTAGIKYGDNTDESFVSWLETFEADLKNPAKNKKQVLDWAYMEIEKSWDMANYKREVSNLINGLEAEALKIYVEKFPQTRYVFNDENITLRYIQQLKRVKSLKDFFVDAYLAIKAIRSEPRVVALNMVQPEDDPRSLKDFNLQMEILDYLWKKDKEQNVQGTPLNFSLHGGELVLEMSPVEPMASRIRDTIEKGHALRIGHGVSIPWEENVVPLLESMNKNKIMVEICLTSNEGILGIKNDRHPFMLYKSAGVPLSIATDDEGINRSNLTMEFVKAARRYDLSYDYIKTLIRNSLEYSFLEGTSLFENGDYTKILNDYKFVINADFIVDDWKVFEENNKLIEQIKLERAFIEFEESLNRGFVEFADRD